MAQAPTILQARLGSLRRTARLRFLGGGLARTCTTALLLVMTLVGLDWLAHPHRPVRLVLLALAAACAAAAARRWLWAPLAAAMTEEDLALAVEARFPALQDRLISALQLPRRGAPAFNAPGLVERVIAEADEVLQGVRFAEAIPMPRLPRWTLGAFACAAAFSALTAVSPTFRTGLRRLVQEVPWPSPYALALELPATRIAQGDDLSVTARSVGERLPRRAVLNVRPEGDAEPYARTMEFRDGAFHAVLEHLDRDVTVWLTAADFRGTDTFVKVLKRATVASLQVRLSPPAYTGLPETALTPNTGHLKAIRGTRVRVEGTASKPLQSAVLRFAKRELRLAVSAGKGFGGEFTVEEADAYVISMKDAEDLVSDHPVSYQVTILRDAEPVVRLTRPGRDLHVLPTAKVSLAVEAQDDWGLAGGDLVHLARGAAEADAVRSLLFAAPAAKDVRALKASLVWDLAPLKLEPGRQVRYRAEARDRDDVSGPNIGRSPEFTLTVVSREDLERDLQDRLAAMGVELERARESARTLRTGIQELPGAAAERREGAAAALALDAGRLAESLRRVREGVAAVQDAVAMNDARDPLRDDMLEGARAGLEALSSQRLPAISERLRAAGRGEPEALDQARQGQEEAIAEIEKVRRAFEGAASFGEILRHLEKLIHDNELIRRHVAPGGKP